MGLARVFAGLLWLCATTSAVAALVGSPTPANPCPIAQRYCRARGPESGVPHDYPPRRFLRQMRIHCSLTLMQKLARGPQQLFGLGLAPRLCHLMGAFLGATPGEWRALVIAQMGGGDFKTTPAGQQLMRQIKAAARSQLTPVPHGGPFPRPGVGTASGPAWIPDSRAASAALARRLRLVRVALERAMILKTGRPVRLPTGVCTAVLILSPSGRVRQMMRPHCSNSGLQNAFWQAVFMHGPLLALTGRTPYRVHVGVIAPLAEPGLGLGR